MKFMRKAVVNLHLRAASLRLTVLSHESHGTYGNLNLLGVWCFLVLRHLRLPAGGFIGVRDKGNGFGWE